MPTVYHYETTDSISLPEFLEFANKAVNVNSRDGILALGEMFARLGNNRAFLSEYFAKVIYELAPRDPLSFLLAQSVVIARYDSFYLRANFWLPRDGLTAGEAELYAYDQPHDHNFDLLSYAYCGSGYYSDGFHYDYNSVVGFVGEKVRLQPLGRHHHKCGDVLFYECSKDIHIQHAPETPSITLNVLPLGNLNGLIDQYFFEIDSPNSRTGTLKKHAPNVIEQRRHLFDVAKHIGGQKVAVALADIATGHRCARTRYESVRALRTCDPTAHEAVVNTLKSDTAPLVQHYVRSFLNTDL
jgi:hypothetical protein